MRKSMLAAFVEEMGHQHEHLLEGATDEEGSEDDAPLETALLAANARIRDSCKTEEEGSESESESDSAKLLLLSWRGIGKLKEVREAEVRDHDLSPTDLSSQSPLLNPIRQLFPAL